MKNSDVDLIERLSKTALDIRKHIVKISALGGSHIGGALSITDVITALYFHFMDVDPSRPEWEERDNFILSEGHVAISLYIALAKKGFVPLEEVYTYQQRGTIFGTHPTLKVSGVDFATGALGHGLSVAVGMAIASKRASQENKIYTILGDGELQEGSIWEAAMSGPFYQLDNLVAIVNRNRFQGTDITENLMPIEPLVDKWRSFGWSVKRIDGNDMDQVVEALESIPFETQKPSLLITDTIKAKGVPFLEDRAESHSVQLSEDQKERALEELRRES